MLFLVQLHKSEVDYDVPRALVVRAKDEAEARGLAAGACFDHELVPNPVEEVREVARRAFLDAGRSTCNPIDPDGQPAVIVIDTPES